MTACLMRNSCGVSSVEEGHGIAEHPLHHTRTMARARLRTTTQAPHPRVGLGRGHAHSTTPTMPFPATLHAMRWLMSCRTRRMPDIVSGGKRIPDLCTVYRSFCNCLWCTLCAHNVVFFLSVCLSPMPACQACRLSVCLLLCYDLCGWQVVGNQISVSLCLCLPTHMSVK